MVDLIVFIVHTSSGSNRKKFVSHRIPCAWKILNKLLFAGRVSFDCLLPVDVCRSRVSFIYLFTFFSRVQNCTTDDFHLSLSTIRNSCISTTINLPNDSVCDGQNLVRFGIFPKNDKRLHMSEKKKKE